MEDIDSVLSNVQSARQKALLYVFEDNEAVIKMIIKGRSPTMRHVSRTYRVALDWLFDRINLDSKIQIKYIDTKNQLADILTKRKFHTWWVRPSSSLVEWHDFFDVFLPPSSFKQKAECHVQESSRKYSERGVGSGETETNELGAKGPSECEKRSSSRFGWSKQAGESRIGSMLCFIPRPIYSQDRQQDDTQSSSTRKLGGDKKHQTQHAEVRISNSEGRSYTSQHADLRSSVPWESLQEPRGKVESRRGRTSNWYQSVEDPRTALGDNFCRRRWKPPFILNQITLKFWKYTGTRTSRNFSIFSISPRSRYWTINQRFWMWQRLNGHLLHGRDLDFVTIMWSRGRKQKFASIQIPSYAGRKCQIIQMRVWGGKTK